MSDGSLFDLSAFGQPEPEPEAAPVAEPPTDDTADEPATPSTARAETPATGRQTAASQPTALYRKYRPRSFESDDLFGQDHVVNTLRNAIALDRIAHAYLFCGPRGTGKTTTARILAKAVNCEDPDPLRRPCNVCPSCVAINTGATTDVIEIDAASNRGIDDIRDLRERVKYAPSQLRTKFYIIDEAHQITGAAANAFLKTLEEPPAHTKFVLATTDPEDLLQTIVSRCQRFDFRRINLEAMIANLTKVAAAENIDIDDEAKAMIARHATGSLRDAQGLLDQVAVYRENADDSNTTVSVDLVRMVLGVSRNDRVEEIARALADRDAGAGVRAIGDAVAAGDDVRQLARQLLTYMRELLLERSGGHSDLDEAGKKLAQLFDLGELAELTRTLGDIDYKVKHATISQLPLEIAVIEGALRGAAPARQAAPTASEPVSQPRQPEPQAPVAAAGSGNLIGRVRDGGRRPGAAEQPASRQQPAAHTRQVQENHPPQQPQTRPTPPPAAPTAPGEVSIDGIRNQWGRIKADVNAVNLRTGALMSEMDPVALDGDRLILTVPYPFHASKMNSEDTRPVVEQVVSRVMGKPLKLECFTHEEYRNRPAPSGPSSHTAAPTSQPQEDAGPSDQPDPEPASHIDASESLKAVRNIFDAEEIVSPDR
jgi:DNA polymerase-3 subunit gamma/tau